MTPGDVPYYAPDPEISNWRGGVTFVTAPAAAGLIVTLSSFVLYNNRTSDELAGMNVLPSAEAGAVGPGSATLVNKPEVGPVHNGGGE